MDGFDASLGSFQVLLQVFAASIDGLDQPGSWNSRRPRLEAVLGGAQEETEPAEWDEDANCVRDAGWIPSGKECPWRFNAVMLFTTSMEELQSESGLSFRLRIDSDISLGLVKVQLPSDIAGEATADLLRHVLPICSPVHAQDWFRWSSSVQMVSLKSSDGVEVGQVAVSFALDADPKELLSAASSGARPRSRKQISRAPVWWLDWHCCTSASGRRICSEECDEEHKERKDASLSLPTLMRRIEPQSLPPPEQSPEGWISRKGPGGRIFWHHKALGPAPWEQQVPTSLTRNKAFFRSIMGKVADLTDTPLSSEIL